MSTPPFSMSDGVPAGKAFGLVGLLFALAFACAAWLFALDQRQVSRAVAELRGQTLPAMARQQQVARKLTALHQAGERIFSADSAAGRLSALAVVTLNASDPMILATGDARSLAYEAELFLGDVVRQTAADGPRPFRFRDNWSQLAARIDGYIDRSNEDALARVHRDLALADEAMDLARRKLLAVMAMVALFLMTFVFLVRRHLIQPLQRLHRALADLNPFRPVPEFGGSRMLEIRSVESAIVEQHGLLVQNDEVRRTLESLANKDGLTGLMNRRYFLQTAEIELVRAQRYRRRVTLGMADLDFFKRLNDTYGHAAGDAVLCQFALMVKQALRQSDLVCRWGGEEFAFLFPEISMAEAGTLAERLRAAWAETAVPLPDGQQVKVTISIGLADASETSVEAALKRADAALYRAKDLGRNRICLADEIPDAASPALPE